MPFLDDRFLLGSRLAEQLYADHAADCPIIDFHNHLSPREIAEDAWFESITDLWLGADHYKWRAMRAHGIPEHLVTGPADDRDRFRAWAATLPSLAMNPLYHWAHLELRRVFAIEAVLGPETADEVYDAVQESLARGVHSPRSMFRRFGVRVVGTTDDPASSLEHHLAIDDPDFVVVPTFRPDRASAIDVPREYDAYLTRLAESANLAIDSPRALLEALDARHRAFHEAGCRASDHGHQDLEHVPFDASIIERIWQRVRSGRAPAQREVETFRSWLLHELALMDHHRGWVSQYHVGALRNQRTRLSQDVGPDAGGDAIGEPLGGSGIAAFLNELDKSERLPKTILYNMRPSDSDMVASIAGSFNDGTVRGKVQPGAAWWFADSVRGIERQLRVIADVGVLGHSVGMVTDSRSFLSLTRHEYFRRILCNLLAEEVQRGLLPDDDGLLGELIEGVCWKNALEFIFPDLAK